MQLCISIFPTNPNITMKTRNHPVQKWNGIPFLILLLLVVAQTFSFAQSTPTVFALATFQKVNNASAFEKIMAENWKPLHQLRKQNGKITSWSLYKVHFSGSGSEYNYVSVMYFDSYQKTEPNDNYPELMKAANPKADVPAIMDKTASVRTIVRSALYQRENFTTDKTGAPPTKYINLSYMKPKDGQDNSYFRMENEIAKKIHQSIVDAGQKNAWRFWSLNMPAGTFSDHDYVTANAYASYEQMGAVDMAGAFKKAFPDKDIQVVSDEVTKTRNVVKNELWELVLTLN